MQIRRIKIQNFRGIKDAELVLPKHVVLIGDNNAGKTTILEAIDLVLGPDRLSRQPPIDEHDFFDGRYSAEPQGVPQPEVAPVQRDGQNPPAPPKIEIEVTIADVSEEQRTKFGDYAEWWDQRTNAFYVEPNPAGVDAATITQALRVTFIGNYDPVDDDFEGTTYFTRSLTESENPVQFRKREKQLYGFLYLRSLRTGTRALSLERGYF